MNCALNYKVSDMSRGSEYTSNRRAIYVSVNSLSYCLENSSKRFRDSVPLSLVGPSRGYCLNRYRAAPLHKRRRVYHDTLNEICDSKGVWHTGWLTFGRLAQVIGTTTADLIQRLVKLGILEHSGQRHRLTMWARKRCYGEIYRKKKADGTRLEIDVILPQGMVILVQNLEYTNQPMTEVEILRGQGLSQRAIANRLGISQPAVKKRLDTILPRLANWPVVGSWH